MPYKNPEDKNAWQRANRHKQAEYRERWLAGPRGQQYLQKQKEARLLQKLSRPKRRKPPRDDKSTRYRLKCRSYALALLGNCCKICGMDDDRCLHIDHIVPVGKERRRSDTWQEVLKSHKEARELTEEFQLLCANCHAIKTKENGEQGGAYWKENDPNHAAIVEVQHDLFATGPN